MKTPNLLIRYNIIFSTLLKKSNGKLETAVSNKKGNNDI